VHYCGQAFGHWNISRSRWNDLPHARGNSWHFYRATRTFLQTSLVLAFQSGMSIFGYNSSGAKKFRAFPRSCRISGTLLAFHSFDFKEHAEAKQLFLNSPGHPPSCGGGSPRDGSGPRQEVSPISRRRPELGRGRPDRFAPPSPHPDTYR